jgi:hypothetical protein
MDGIENRLEHLNHCMGAHNVAKQWKIFDIQNIFDWRRHVLQSKEKEIGVESLYFVASHCNYMEGKAPTSLELRVYLHHNIMRFIWYFRLVIGEMVLLSNTIRIAAKCWYFCKLNLRFLCDI